MRETTKVISLPAAGNRSGALRLRLVIAMIVAYLATMAFLIHSARQTAVAEPDFSPAMVAVAICMSFSVILTGLFVVAQRGD